MLPNGRRAASQAVSVHKVGYQACSGAGAYALMAAFRGGPEPIGIDKGWLTKTVITCLQGDDRNTWRTGKKWPQTKLGPQSSTAGECGAEVFLQG